ncbi:hypothetical protein GCM10010909_34290 [Acidocella aquatica]|uniref:Glycosyltransferase RgtA/B/C/D-like domain-containing protein n=1 Tax=Acidocella aquatica TaxID=1922313 RepID=A0ABQ6AAG7_9PROT|nr:hypothetical protein [Acidocella aquatica]GLR68747.1 hypothetical protein GCM10010909_34290 [Acidocella aquatica]
MKLAGFLLFAAALLGFIAWHRAPEYDEAYSIFLTAGHARPPWPTGAFTAGSVRGLFSGHASLSQIAHDLRTGDVHPPLYFWALESWRQIAGPSWFAARLLSVAFSLAALAVGGWFASLAAIPLLPALSFTLFTYGFAYTGIIARNFALAQFFNLLGFTLVFLAVQRRRRRLALAGGLALGAAAFTNYLAVFTACAVLLWLCLGRERRRHLLPAACGLTPFLLADAWFFAAQHGSRAGQFAAFSPLPALRLLVKDFGAAQFGGLPLYAGHFAPELAAALAVLFLAALACILLKRSSHALPLALAAAAPPLGLLALGAVFNNTPIEIRYLAFAMPYLALLLAAALPRPLLIIMLAVEFCAILGLAFSPATMQPQGFAAHQAAALPGTLILLPFGNDGVGIPGPFISQLPDTARVALLRPGQMPALNHTPSIALITLTPDAASRAALTRAQAYFAAQKCFTETPASNLLTKILNRCAD